MNTNGQNENIRALTDSELSEIAGGNSIVYEETGFGTLKFQYAKRDDSADIAQNRAVLENLRRIQRSLESQINAPVMPDETRRRYKELLDQYRREIEDHQRRYGL